MEHGVRVRGGRLERPLVGEVAEHLLVAVRNRARVNQRSRTPARLAQGRQQARAH
jgi:hypothetical protein